MTNDQCQMTNGAGLVELTPEAVGQLLGLKEGVRVTGVQWEPVSHLLMVRVDGPGLPEVAEGMLPRLVGLEAARENTVPELEPGEELMATEVREKILLEALGLLDHRLYGANWVEEGRAVWLYSVVPVGDVERDGS